MNKQTDRIRPEGLAEHYFRFLHGVMAKLQKAFRETGGTQKKLAERLGKQPAVISRLLAGQGNVTLRTMHDLARAMGYRLQVDLVPLTSVALSNHPFKRQGGAASSTDNYLIQ